MDLCTPSWSSFKTICVTQKALNLQYVDTGDAYRVIGPDANGINWVYDIPKFLSDGTTPTSDAADFVATLQSACNGKISIAQLDPDGALQTRLKVAPTGWNFNYRMVELQLSTHGSLTNNDVTGADVGDAVMKLYDASGTLLTGSGVEATAVKTVIDLEPPYNICVVGGSIRMDAKPTQDVYVNVIAVPDVPYAYGGSKVFVQNVNLSYIDGAIGLNADGRAAKQLTYSSSYHTNKFRFQFTHPAGYQFWCGILMEIYRQ